MCGRCLATAAILICSVLNSGSASCTRLIFNHLTSDNGLPTNDVTAFYEDSFGFIWFGTREGLLRYDGSGFVSFTFSAHDQASIPSNNVLGIAESNDHKLLVCTSGGLWVYNLVSEKSFRIVTNKSFPEKGVLNNYVSSIHPEHNNRFWLRYSKGLSLFDLNTLTFRHFRAGRTTKDNFKKLDYFQIFENAKGNFYLSIEYDHVYRWHGEQWVPYSIQTINDAIFYVDRKDMVYLANERFAYFDGRSTQKPELTEWRFSNASVYSIVEDTMGQLWVATGDGIYLLDISTRKVMARYSQMGKDNFKIPYQGVWKLYNYGDKLYAFAEFEYIYIIDIHNFTCEIVKNDILNTLSTNYKRYDFTSLFNDRSNALWLRFEGGGLDYFDFNQRKFDLLVNSRDSKFPIIGGANRGVYADSKNYIWAGNEKALYCYDRRQDVFYTHPTGIVNCVKAVNDEDIWVAEIWLKKFRFNKKTGQLSLVNEYKPIYGDSTSLSNWYVTYLTFTKDSNLWICTSAGVSLMKKQYLNTKNAVFKNYYYNPLDKSTLPGANAWHIFEDSKGYLWVSTTTGLGVLDRKSNKFKQYLFDPSNPYSISTDNVKCVTEDHKGRIWVATEGGGICQYLPDKDGFVAYNTSDGLPSNAVYSILKDNNNRFWVSTKRGLCVFHPDSLVFTQYTKHDGLQANDFNIQSFHRNDVTSELFFGGPGGFSYFNPDSIRKSSYGPPVYITDFYVNSLKIRPDTFYTKETILRKSILLTDSVRLTYKQNSIQLRFASLHFITPSGVRYKYKLEGFDKSYITTDNNRNYASYNNLSPGEYIFRLRATNCDGVWGSQERILYLRILPPWWATWWFRIGLFLFIVGTAYGYYRYRLNALKREKRILEVRVAERTAELSEANAQLEERQEEIMAQKEELEVKNDQIGKAYNNMQVISEFGQRVTSTLNIEAINQMIYDYVTSLMDTAAFGIGVFNEKRKVIEFLHFVEMGEVLPYFVKDLNSDTSLSVRCFVNREEIIIGNLSEEYKQYLAALPEVRTSRLPVSMVHLPLVAGDKTIGTLTVNSFREDAYGPVEINNLRSIASYISIALDNATVYKVLNLTNVKVKNSIEYASTIQKAILPLREAMDKHFGNFVIFKPKDVVSGDFYWMQTAGNAIYFAVADCTGHGVPGAFMSLIGSRLLDEIVMEKGISQPSAILEYLDVNLQAALRQGETENNDGMDVCLIRLENQKIKVSNTERAGGEGVEMTGVTSWMVTFCGAMRPLYIISKDGLMQLKGDRRSIGGKRTTRKTNIAFTDRTLQLFPGNTLYLGSDGLTDQNNAAFEKFGVERFEKILKLASEKSLDEQKRILEEALESHQGNEEQRDDITLVSLRLL